ncbi:MAG: hypothetical protein FWE22_06030 [Firmicutes bacterium]|nr:hypothetical protein [Bacillota bacterium]
MQERLRSFRIAALVVGLFGATLATIGGVIYGGAILWGTGVVSGFHLSYAAWMTLGVLKLISAAFAVVGAILAVRGRMGAPFALMLSFILVLVTTIFINMDIVSWISLPFIFVSFVLSIAGRQRHIHAREHGGYHHR